MFISKATLWDRSNPIQGHILATRFSFFSLGFATAAWAPLIPFAQQRLHLNHADFGMLLLCAGIGSFLSMPATGALIQKFGCKIVIGFALLAMLSLLPLLSIFNTAVLMAMTLFIFGTVVGSLSVAINMQAVIVEKQSMADMMSSFHGMCSLGGLMGVAWVSILLALGVAPLLATLSISMVLVMIVLFAVPHCITTTENLDTNKVSTEKVTEQAATFKLKQLKQPTLLLIGLVCFICFLSEGAAMDWSGIYLVNQYQLDSAYAGFAYTCFAIAMTIGRFSGKTLLQYWGVKQVVLYGAVLAAFGLFLIVCAPHWSVVLLGYCCLGFGSSNIVPIMFSRVGEQNIIPKAAALSLVSTIAYSGSLLGPALIGFLSEAIGLSNVFALIALLLLMIVVLNKFTLIKA